MLVILSSDALYQPDIQEIENILGELVAGRGFFVKDFVEIRDLVVEVGAAYRAVRYKLRHLVERGIGGRRLIIFDPDAQAQRVDAEFGVELLEEIHPAFIAPEKYMGIGFGDRERIFHYRLYERTVLGFRLAVIMFAAVLRFSTNTFVVRKTDVVRHIVVDHVCAYAVHKLLRALRVGGVRTNQTMAAQSKHIARLDLRSFGALDLFFFVQLVVFDFEVVVEDAAQVFVIESGGHEFAEVKIRRELCPIPIRTRAVRGEEIVAELGIGQGAVRYPHFDLLVLAPKQGQREHALISCNQRAVEIDARQFRKIKFLQTAF